MHAHRAPHLKAAIHVVKYLQGTINHGLHYDQAVDSKIHAYSDSNWSRCVFSSRSLSTYVVFLGSNLVSWKTKKQSIVSKSSTEAKYKIMSNTTNELVWIHGLLEYF